MPEVRSILTHIKQHCLLKKVLIQSLYTFEKTEDIRDLDAKRICSIKRLLVNLEISTNNNIVKNALRIKPKFICIVPENRNEITTEGGLNLKKNKNKIKKIISQFKKKKIRTSLFVNPNIKDIYLSKEIGADCVEIHTGHFSNLIKSKKSFIKEFLKIKKCAILASKIGVEVHAGHGLDFKSTKKILTKINEIVEFNIGHFIIGESIFYGLPFVIKKFKRIIKN